MQPVSNGQSEYVKQGIEMVTKSSQIFDKALFGAVTFVKQGKLKPNQMEAFVEKALSINAVCKNEEVETLFKKGFFCEAVDLNIRGNIHQARHDEYLNQFLESESGKIIYKKYVIKMARIITEKLGGIDESKSNDSKG